MSAEIQVPLMSARSGEPSSDHSDVFLGPKGHNVSTKTACFAVLLAIVAAAGITVAIMLSVGFYLPGGAGGPGAMRVLILNGQGLDVRGQTEKSRIQFGSSAVYSDYVKIAKDSARELGVEVEVRQSNDEAEFVRWVRTAAQEGFDAMLMNPSGFLKSTAVGRRCGNALFWGALLERSGKRFDDDGWPKLHWRLLREQTAQLPLRSHWGSSYCHKEVDAVRLPTTIINN